MTDSQLAKLTGPQQVAVMGRLNQQASAWLLNLSARALRDYPDAARQSDGTYNGRALVAWARDHAPRVELPDEQVERLLVIADEMSADYQPMGVVVAELRRLQREHGADGLLAFAQTLLEHWGAHADACGEEMYPSQYRPPTADQLRVRAEQQRSAEEDHRRRLELRVCAVCNVCGKLRRGRAWIKAPPPADYIVEKQTCGACRSDRRLRLVG